MNDRKLLMSESEINVTVAAIGRAAGKTKYLLLDKDDSQLCDQYCLEPRVVADANGCGANIFAWAFNSHYGRHKGRYVHNIIWELHCGSITEDMKVVQKNGIGMDCRLDNLALIPVSSQSPLLTADETGIYWRAVQHVVVNPVLEVFTESHGYYSRNGDPVSSDDCVMFYECHYVPCTKTEQHMQQFNVCGRCQSARYCSSSCQQRDWTIHRKFCRYYSRLREFIDR